MHLPSTPREATRPSVKPRGRIEILGGCTRLAKSLHRRNGDPEAAQRTPQKCRSEREPARYDGSRRAHFRGVALTEKKRYRSTLAHTRNRHTVLIGCFFRVNAVRYGIYFEHGRGRKSVGEGMPEGRRQRPYKGGLNGTPRHRSPRVWRPFGGLKVIRYIRRVWGTKKRISTVWPLAGSGEVRPIPFFTSRGDHARSVSKTL